MTVQKIIGVLTLQSQSVVVEEDAPPVFLEVFNRTHVHRISVVAEIERVGDCVGGPWRVVGSGGRKRFFSLDVISSSSLHFIDKLYIPIL